MKNKPEYDLLAYLVLKNQVITDKIFKDIYNYKNYFSLEGQKLIDILKDKRKNKEVIDIDIFLNLSEDYTRTVLDNADMDIGTEYATKDYKELLTELEKGHAKEIAQEIINSNNVSDMAVGIDKLKTVFTKTKQINKIDLKQAAKKFFQNIDNLDMQNSVKAKNWHRFNKVVKLYKGDVTVIAGRPGSGKTTFALSLALEFAKNGSEGLFFSLEMGEEQIINRMMSQLSLVPISKFQDSFEAKNLTQEEHGRITNAVEEMQRLADNLQIISGNFSSNEILEIAENDKPEFIIIDYMQLLRTSEGHGRVEEITYLSMELKRIAMKLQIPVIELCQLSRAVEQRADKKPILSDLRESGQIEQDASVVIGIYREAYYNEEADPEGMDCIILKNRNGNTGTMPFKFLGAVQKVYEGV